MHKKSPSAPALELARVNRVNHMKIHEYDEHTRQEPHQEGLTERKIQLIVRERGITHALSKKLAAVALFFFLVVNEKKPVRQCDDQRSDE